MASVNRLGGWRWGSLRPWQVLHTRLAESDMRGSPLEIWSILDEALPGVSIRDGRYPEPTYSHLRFILDDDEDFWSPGGIMETRLRDWVASRSLEHDEINVRPIDTKAVLNKCRKETYKPKLRGSSKGKSVAEQEDCPVCLEKFTSGQSLLTLPCNHKFHKDCLTPWIQNNHGCCPTCRADILTSSPGTTTTTLAANVRSAENTSSTLVASNNGNSNNSARSGRREGEDIMSVLTAMEAALERLGLRS